MLRRPRFLTVLIGLAIAIGIAAPVSPLVLPAAAQYQERNSGGLWGAFQRSRRERAERRQRAIEHLRERREEKPRRARSGSSRKAKAAARSAVTVRKIRPTEPEPVKKASNAKTILVIGDFLADGMAEGLEAVFRDDAAVRIVNRANGSSGLVRDDYYDWPASIGQILEAEKPVAVVLMLGSNDRQGIRIGSDRVEAQSAAWVAEYTARATVLAASVEERRIPLLWVGMPSFKQPKLSSDMLALNDIFRGVSASVDAEFVDIWEGFVDENGAFVSTGPDINGQPVRLRSGDGINLTSAGKRKAAFYVEKPLRAYLGETGVPVAKVYGPFYTPGSGIDTTPAEIVRTVPIALSDPQLDGGTELLGSDPSGLAAMKPAPTSSRPQTGRADAFGPQQPSRQAARPPTVEETSAIRN